jgi:hypothetical protein
MWRGSFGSAEDEPFWASRSLSLLAVVHQLILIGNQSLGNGNFTEWAEGPLVSEQETIDNLQLDLFSIFGQSEVDVATFLNSVVEGDAHS